MDKIKQIKQELKKAVLGKDEILDYILVALFSKGHVLLEDIPGVGKTNLALALTKATQLKYQRVQLTSDVLPSDLLGYSVFSMETQKMTYQKGPVLTNIFLADEINRTSSKTQSALLQVMEEGKVTVDGKTYETPAPFMVIATQNPFGSAGTQLLPDSQLDRFMMKLSLGYPDKESEIEIIKRKRLGNPLDQINPVISIDEIIKIQEDIEKVYLSYDIERYIVEIVQGTRCHPSIAQGASPRASLALMKASQAYAYIQGRDYVIDDDIQQLLYPILNHRFILAAHMTPSEHVYKDIFQDILKNVTPFQYKL